MKEKTPIEQLIEETQRNIDAHSLVRKVLFTADEQDIYNLRMFVWNEIIKQATKYLQLEKERDNGIASEAWDAGFERGASVVIGPYSSKVPNKEMYISQLNKQS